MKSKLTIVLLLMQLCAISQAALPHQVVIDEIMADPTPIVGLPAVEYIELRNTSNSNINLQGWRLGDNNGTATIGTAFLLQPDSQVILCANASVSLLTGYGGVIGVSNFPSLDNDGETLYLLSKEGRTIHAVSYNSSWYANSIKRLGGWSLEMIDVHNACAGAANWIASPSAAGGTPGKKNAADAINEDREPPALIAAYAEDETHIVLVFNEPLDSAQAAVAGHYSAGTSAASISSVAAIPPLFNTVKLTTAAAITSNKIYMMDITSVSDCAGNHIGAYHTIKVGLPVKAANNDVVINEVLFNPPAGGADYLELYNRSNNIIDVNDCYVATRSATAAVSPPKQISAAHRLLFPGDYLLLTEDSMSVNAHYLAKDPAAFLLLSPMPSLPDDKGDVLLRNAQGVLLDELAYDTHWHFPLLNNIEGVALERIDYNRPAQDAGNWHSAATSAGYGTPGYQNSQFHTDGTLQGKLALSSPIFSPDNDGMDDFVSVQYQFPEAGYVCNISIFDASGRPVRYLIHNAICAQAGYFRWDGLSENSTRLPIGVYVVRAEVFNLQGKTQQFKQAVTLARKFR